LTQGLVTPDENNLGIRTAAYGALIGSHGRAAPNLFYVGPMLRADHWEATAAHELRGHAEQLAAYLAAPVGRFAPHGQQAYRAAKVTPFAAGSVGALP